MHQSQQLKACIAIVLHIRESDVDIFNTITAINLKGLTTLSLMRRIARRAGFSGRVMQQAIRQVDARDAHTRAVFERRIANGGWKWIEPTPMEDIEF